MSFHSQVAGRIQMARRKRLPLNHYSFTINTDASHEPKTGTAAWAAWIRSSHYLIKEAAVFDEPQPNSSVAELLAIEQALILLDNLINEHEFLQYYHERKAIVLYINTDSMWTIHAMRGIVKRSKHVKEARRVKSLADQFVIVPRHVKGHSDGDTPRSWVNNWCDRAARGLLRKRMEEINGRSKATEKV